MSCFPLGLRGLRRLQLGGNQLTSLAALHGLGQLQELSAEYNRIKDSKGVEVSAVRMRGEEGKEGQRGYR
jgi:Leucine-rich repeat (LRR) protein